MRYIFFVSLSIFGKGSFILIHTQTMSSGIFSRQILGIYMMHVDTLIHTLHYITLHCIALHYITLHCIALHYITLHCIALHYITLHYIHTYIRHTYIIIHTYIFMKSLYEFVRTYEHKHTHTHKHTFLIWRKCIALNWNFMMATKLMPWGFLGQNPARTSTDCFRF